MIEIETGTITKFLRPISRLVQVMEASGHKTIALAFAVLLGGLEAIA
jgi:hypothetical protein